MPTRGIPVLALRIAVVILGGYALMTGFAAVTGLGLIKAGLAPSEAVLLASMLAFLVYLAVILWGFHARSLAWLAGLVCGGAAASIGLAILLAPAAI